MSKQQLKCIFAARSAANPAPRPKKHMPTTAPRPAPRSKTRTPTLVGIRGKTISRLYDYKPKKTASTYGP